MRSESASKNRPSAAPGGGELDMDGRGFSHGSHGVDGRDGKLMKGAATKLQRRAAGLHAFEVEDVVDEADEPIGVGDGDAEEILGLGVERSHDA